MSTTRIRRRPRGLDLGVWAPPWMAKALCRKVGSPSDWHPATEHQDTIRDVREVCRACPVQIPCLERVLSDPKPLTGVWAGTTTRQRRGMRTEIRKAQRRAT